MTESAPARRARSTAGRSRRARRRRLGGRGVAEREAQRAAGASRRSAPIASSTCEGWATPAEQAEPVEHSTPRASSSISSESPSQPGKDRCAMPGSRSSGSPLHDLGVGTSARTPASSRSRSAATRARVPGAALDGDRGRGGQPDRAGHVQRAGTDVALLAAAVQQRLARDVAAQQQRAGADRAAELVRRSSSARRRRWRRSRPAACRPPAPRRCGTARRTRARPRRAPRPAGRCRPRCWPTSRVTSAVASGRSASAARSASGCDPAECVDRQPDDLGALVRDQPLDGVEHGVVLDRRWR